MTLDEAIEFIAAKLQLVADYADSPESKAHALKALAGLERLCAHPRLSLQQLRSLDGEMIERWMFNSLTPNGETEIRQKLVARFKTSRLRATDKAVARRVLKRGEIADLEEYYQVKEFVSCVDNIEVVGEENYGILDSLLETFDAPDEDDLAATDPAATVPPTSSRRRAPPPFDFTLESDEKLCSPDTPFEDRGAFLRLKFSLVAGHLTFPEDSPTLETQLLRGLTRALGPQPTDEHRTGSLEHVEHEAEFFTAGDVNGAQHRAIEAELERKFGFRRLGPSAQNRLARMLATDDAGGWSNRLIIERFIYNYPHQTLFSRDEIKRAAAILKKPSPGAQPVTLAPRPKTPPDLSLLCVGAVFKLKHGPHPHRVVAFDNLEVFSDVHWGEGVGWGLDRSRNRAGYYQTVTPLFLEGAERLRIDEPTPEFLALHRPDLPLRFGRSARLQWLETPFSTREALAAHVALTDPDFLTLPPINARQLALFPRSPKGAVKPAILVTADSHQGLRMIDLLWHAHLHQRPPKRSDQTGIGFYRSGLAKRGVPSYYLADFMGPSGALHWHANAPIAP